MKSMRPPLVAIFFMTYFHGPGEGGHGPLRPPPGSATATNDYLKALSERYPLLVPHCCFCFPFSGNRAKSFSFISFNFHGTSTK